MLTLAAAMATAALAQVGDKIGDKLGPLQAPPGGKAYRVTWDGSGGGYVEATVDAAGQVRMRRGGPVPPATDVPLEPGDLAAFEQALARSPFAATPPRPYTPTCVDDCSEFFLTVANDGMAKTLHAPPIFLTAEEARTGRRSGGPAIMDVADELIQLASARSGDRRGRPAFWWARDDQERPSPRLGEVGDLGCAPVDTGCARAAWAGLRAGLGIPELMRPVQDPAQLLYRLVWIPAEGRAESILVARTPSACGYWIPAPGADCSVRSVISTPARPKPRKVSPADGDRFESALYAAGFSTLAADPQTRCPTGDHWVLEAYVYSRYRYVAGSSCDLRGLDEPIAQLRRWAR